MNHYSPELFLHTDTSKLSQIHYNWHLNKQMIEAVSEDLATYPFTTDTVLFCLYMYQFLPASLSRISHSFEKKGAPET